MRLLSSGVVDYTVSSWERLAAGNRCRHEPTLQLQQQGRQRGLAAAAPRLRVAAGCGRTPPKPRLVPPITAPAPAPSLPQAPKAVRGNLLLLEADAPDTVKVSP